MHPISEHLKQILTHLKEETDNTTIVGDFCIPLSTMEKSFRKKINKKMLDLNETLDQINLIDIYRIFHPMAAEYAFFSSSHRIFSWTDYMTCHYIKLKSSTQWKK